MQNSKSFQVITRKYDLNDDGRLTKNKSSYSKKSSNLYHFLQRQLAPSFGDVYNGMNISKDVIMGSILPSK